ncbi:GNAT family N-acetyltransferase [Zhouia spongiae]|uniref:GNAT family N-acetyltransferase n=1 Tax=Zhouia spongiae TaxID=2202721 RepID=A0ABY3YQK1_9FLAO|nr:GNAT family N-acetyltransferase [Zhouia spongiae]UNY99928.1 GNAT family N-acetyltransferase [Zhouia spongiae]
MNIRISDTGDIDQLLKVTRACADFMIKNGIFQWNEHYPSRKAFEGDIERNELYVLENDDRSVIGSIVISTIMDDVYKPVKWLTSNNRNHIYIHRLAVHPDHQGKGYAQMLMDHAEDHAKQNGYESVRLDTFSKNLRNQKFYELRGYKRLDKIFFPEKSEHPFYCYEKLLG